ncbi:hypothetical protein GE061_013552 [Apolygus lucorum]|uniref:Aminopeptidase N n=1 Tax=Apolygus lucorum TaxID=248454 RepID=A0A8S9XQX2_APOLU|nr:hypothetical protein GE061_013552 [Apolygus lucorum]
MDSSVGQKTFRARHWREDNELEKEQEIILAAPHFDGPQRTINTPSKVIVLNTLDLDIKSSNLKLGDGKVLKPSDTIINKAEETITLNFGSDLATGEAFLSFEFSGVLNDSLKGLYRSRTSTMKTKIGRELVWDFFKSNWKRILEIYEGGFLLPRLVKRSLENFASESKAAEIENFFKSVDYSAATRSILQATESIRLNAAWLNRDGDQIKKFLVNFKY